MATPVRAQGPLNIEEMYNNTLRTQSNACFLSKKQQSEEEMEVLHDDTHQTLVISPMLQDMVIHRRTPSEIELAMAGYFDASDEASEMCRQLLRSIESTQSNYQSMDRFLASISSDGSAREPIITVRSNPFRTMTRSNFRRIHDRHSSILQSIRSSHRRVTRKVRMVKAVKKLSRACVLMVCGAAAAGAAGGAAHLLFFGLLIVPGLCPAAALRRRRRRLAVAAREMRPAGGTAASLVRLREQLDAAAKGAYVLGRDLDTVSHLVARLSDGIERENAMARRCAERAGDRCPVPEMVGELRRSCSSSRRLTDELEEHVCLCLATIHRVRLLVIQEISKQPWM